MSRTATIAHPFVIWERHPGHVVFATCIQFLVLSSGSSMARAKRLGHAPSRPPPAGEGVLSIYIITTFRLSFIMSEGLMCTAGRPAGRPAVTLPVTLCHATHVLEKFMTSARKNGVFGVFLHAEFIFDANLA